MCADPEVLVARRSHGCDQGRNAVVPDYRKLVRLRPEEALDLAQVLTAAAGLAGRPAKD